MNARPLLGVLEAIPFTEVKSAILREAQAVNAYRYIVDVIDTASGDKETITQTTCRLAAKDLHEDSSMMAEECLLVEDVIKGLERASHLTADGYNVSVEMSVSKERHVVITKFRPDCTFQWCGMLITASQKDIALGFANLVK